MATPPPINVLIDTSIWIEFFSARPTIDIRSVELLVEERQTVTCFPVIAEVLSGHFSSERAYGVIRDGLFALRRIDPDWNVMKTWLEVANFAQVAKRHRLKMPGIVDRMIVLAARQGQAAIWTLDKTLHAFIPYANATLYSH